MQPRLLLEQLVRAHVGQLRARVVEVKEKLATLIHADDVKLFDRRAGAGGKAAEQRRELCGDSLDLFRTEHGRVVVKLEAQAVATTQAREPQLEAVCEAEAFAGGECHLARVEARRRVVVVEAERERRAGVGRVCLCGAAYEVFLPLRVLAKALAQLTED